MKKKDLIALVGGIGVFLGTLLFGIHEINKERIPELPFKIYTDKKHETKRGVKVYAKNKLDKQFLNWIDESLNELEQDLLALGYNGFNRKEASIYVKHDCTNRNGTPSWLIRADDYDGSIYDQNPQPGIGEIFVAEYVITSVGRVHDKWIICLSNDETYVKNATRYGKEHIELFKQNLEEFFRTYNHSDGSSHPLIPRRH